LILGKMTFYFTYTHRALVSFILDNSLEIPIKHPW
jgi:hypothetical protein